MTLSLFLKLGLVSVLKIILYVQLYKLSDIMFDYHLCSEQSTLSIHFVG